MDKVVVELTAWPTMRLSCDHADCGEPATWELRWGDVPGDVRGAYCGEHERLHRHQLISASRLGAVFVHEHCLAAHHHLCHRIYGGRACRCACHRRSS